MSYNVRYFGHALRGLASTGRSKRGVAEGLAGLDPLPDIVCLQEVETVSLRSTLAHRRAHDAETQLEAFMAQLERAVAARTDAFPYEAFYFRAHAYRVGNVPLYTTGLAVLVNTQRLRIDRHNADAPHAITHHHVAQWKDRKQSRICAHMRLTDAHDRALHVFNTHLSLPTPFHRNFWAERDKMGFGVNQVQEAHTLASFVQRHAGDEPFVVCGDFNAPPGSRVYRYLTEQACFLDPQAALGQIDPNTLRGFPTAGFAHLRMHLDHFFSGGALDWVDLEGTAPFGDRLSAFHGLSDHVPLVARFDLAHAR